MSIRRFAVTCPLVVFALAAMPALAGAPPALCRLAQIGVILCCGRSDLMENLNVVQQRNRELASRINDESRANPESAYAGKFVGLAGGQVVVVADSLDEVVERLRQVETDAQRTFCIEAGLDYEAVQSIWRLV
jgi:hypothetical protein